MSWKISHDSPLIEAKRRRGEGEDPESKKPRGNELDFRIIPTDETQFVGSPDPALGLTLSQLATQLLDSTSWVSVRFALVLRARCERFRRVFFTEWLQAKAELRQLEAETEEARGDEDAPKGDPDLEPNRDAKEIQTLIARRANEMLLATNETLGLLRPDAKVVTARTRVDWGFDTLREDLRKTLLELDGFIGLDSVKQEMANILSSMLIEESVVMPDDMNGPPSGRTSKLKLRQRIASLLLDIETTDADGEGPELVPEAERTERLQDRFAIRHLNFLLLGAPGTGKSTLAKSITKFLGASGLLPQRITEGLLDTTRAELVGRATGQTAVKTKTVLLRSLGTSVFVDELYSLIADGEDAFGREALDTIVPVLTQFQGLLSFIGAGYENLIRGRVFGANPGLQSRIPYRLQLRNYTAQELNRILVSVLEKEARTSEDAYALTPSALFWLAKFIEGAHDAGLFADTNARGVLNLLQKIKNFQAARSLRLSLAETGLRSPTKQIVLEDVKRGFQDWVAAVGSVRVVFAGETGFADLEGGDDNDLEGVVRD